MTTDSSSSSAEEHRRRRKHKKDKKLKKHKHEKRHKEKRRSKRDDPQEQELLPQPMPAAPPRQLLEPEDDSAAFGPALPPHLVKASKPEPLPQPTAIIGPVMPRNIQETAKGEKTPDADIDEDLTGTFGPLPNATQVELEERALALKLAALEGGGMGSTADQDMREEWMLELPQVGLKTGLAALNNLKRTFHQGKERPDFTDRSSWTKTPQSVAAGPKPVSSKDLEQTAQANYERLRDEEQDSLAKKHKKKHKRDESLVHIHQKKLRKEQREREKELAASGSKAERRPFTRDVDLKLNKIDKNQTKQIVDKAKILNTKFSTGQAKYL